MLCLTIVYCHLLLSAPSPLNNQAHTLNHPVNTTSRSAAYPDAVRPSHAHSSNIVTQVNDTQSLTLAQDNEQWFDIWQRSFTDTMDFTVKQLDGLFENDSTQNISGRKEANAEGRIQLSWEPRSNMLSDTDLRFRIRVRLPALKERVDLLLSDNEDETQNNTIRAARDTGNNDRDRTTIALRFRPEQDSHYSYRVGAGRRDQLYAMTRYKDAFAFSKQWAMLYDAELYYYTRDRLGAELGWAVQYEMSKKHLIRQNNRFYFRDDTNDWLWRHEVHHLFSVDQHNAVIPHLMVEGLSQPNYRVEEIYGGFRWRNNMLRDWLFFEVEPFVLWLREEDFKTSYGLALRVEAYYGRDI
ncbi:hypothetical protein D1814_05310 [Alteromonas sp. BL110]|uniref:hypothetical protein n=1 Tax=Alteromonas sp. BL110 TaxID=1714845 RepID=UPI000E4D7F56|nr:hypothetical protein [Alteromonas sp. BL110]AXT38131.1 hypothetical protein D1814_05310 [Alteromonas sp. BL110]RKM80874.1 hypothetical protein D7031_18655 [Alteromonas sp. BL110]